VPNLVTLASITYGLSRGQTCIQTDGVNLYQYDTVALHCERTGNGSSTYW